MRQLTEAEATNEALRNAAMEADAANESLKVDAKDQSMASERTLKLELFESWKLAGSSDKAEKYYEDLLANYLTNDADKVTNGMALDLKHSFVDMLIREAKWEKAEGLAEEVWRKRKGADSLPEIAKESHRQLCSIYASIGRPDKAESMHKLVYVGYPGVPRDDWALENGDGVCRQLDAQRKYEEAAIVQLEVWKERQKPENGGSRHEDTIKSGRSRISILEKLSATFADQSGPEFQRECSRREKDVCEDKIDQMLQEIWSVAKDPEYEPAILEVGHQLGVRHLAQKRYPEAEEFLHRAWEGIKTLFHPSDPSTMLTGRLLADALRLQGSRQKCERAAVIYRKIWEDSKEVFGQLDDRTIPVGVDLAQALSLHGKSSCAQEIYAWVLEQTETKSGRDSPITADARYNLGRAIYRRGKSSYADAAGLLQDVYEKWYSSSPTDVRVLECGHMLIEIYKDQNALDSIKVIFDGRTGLLLRDILWLESGYAYGRMLMQQKDHKTALATMRSLWEYEPALLEEKKFRLRCGRLYGQSLLDDGQYEPARDVLRSVMGAQNGVFDDIGFERREVSRMLEEAQHRMRARTPNRRGGGRVRCVRR